MREIKQAHWSIEFLLSFRHWMEVFPYHRWEEGKGLRRGHVHQR